MIMALCTWFGKEISYTKLSMQAKGVIQTPKAAIYWNLLKGQIKNPFLLLALDCLILFIWF